ncbi:hypothetical protein GQ457_17G003160 [Hibiscus cannabinus]
MINRTRETKGKGKEISERKRKRSLQVATMVVLRLEFCMELVKLAMKFVIAVAEAVEKAINQNDRRQSVVTTTTTTTRFFSSPVPFDDERSHLVSLHVGKYINQQQWSVISLATMTGF